MGWFRIWPYLGAVASLVVFYAFGASYLDGFILDFGNVTYPVARYAYFLLFWMFLGSSCVVFLTLGIARNASTGLMRVLSRWTGASRDVWWLTLRKSSRKVAPSPMALLTVIAPRRSCTVP